MKPVEWFEDAVEEAFVETYPVILHPDLMDPVTLTRLSGDLAGLAPAVLRVAGKETAQQT